MRYASVVASNGVYSGRLMVIELLYKLTDAMDAHENKHTANTRMSNEGILITAAELDGMMVISS